MVGSGNPEKKLSDLLKDMILSSDNAQSMSVLVNVAAIGNQDGVRGRAPRLLRKVKVRHSSETLMKRRKT